MCCSDMLVEAKIETIDMVMELGSAAHALMEAIKQWDSPGGDLQCEEDCKSAESALERLECLALDAREKIEKWRTDCFAKQ